MRAEAGMIAVAIIGFVVGVYFWHGWFIEECIASHNTRAFCEMKFWGP